MKYFQRSLSLSPWSSHRMRNQCLPCSGTEHQAPERASPLRTGYPVSSWMKITDLIWFIGLLHLIVTFFVFSENPWTGWDASRAGAHQKTPGSFHPFSRISYLAEVERKEDLTCPMFGTKVSNINSPIGTCHFIPHNFLLFHWSDVHLRPEGPNDGVRWGTPDSYLEYSLSVFSLPKLKHFGVYTFKSPNQSLHIGITGSSSNFAFRFGLVGFIGVGFLHSEIRRTTNQI